jgi:hypothetical protein
MIIHHAIKEARNKLTFGTRFGAIEVKTPK